MRFDPRSPLSPAKLSVLLATCLCCVPGIGSAAEQPATVSAAAAAPAAPAPSPKAPLPNNQVTTIDFTPRYARIAFDGIASENLYLQSGPDQKIFLRPTSDWNVSGDSRVLHLKSSTLGQAQVDLRAATLKLPEKFDEKWRDEVKARLLKAVPKDAVNAEWLDEKVQPLNINSWRSYESRISYELFGNKYVWGVCWIEVSRTYCIEMSSIGLSHEYPRVRQGGMSLMASWLRPPPAALAKLMR